VFGLTVRALIKGPKGRRGDEGGLENEGDTCAPEVGPANV